MAKFGARRRAGDSPHSHAGAARWRWSRSAKRPERDCRICNGVPGLSFALAFTHLASTASIFGHWRVEDLQDESKRKQPCRVHGPAFERNSRNSEVLARPSSERSWRADVLIVGACRRPGVRAVFGEPDRAAHRGRSTSGLLRRKISTCWRSGREIWRASCFRARSRIARALRELAPDFDKEPSPYRGAGWRFVDTPVTDDARLLPGRKRVPSSFPSRQLPLRKPGNYVKSLEQAGEMAGPDWWRKRASTYSRFASWELLYDKNGIAGVLD